MPFEEFFDDAEKAINEKVEAKLREDGEMQRHMEGLAACMTKALEFIEPLREAYLELEAYMPTVWALNLAALGNDLESTAYTYSQKRSPNASSQVPSNMAAYYRRLQNKTGVWPAGCIANQDQSVLYKKTPQPADKYADYPAMSQMGTSDPEITYGAEQGGATKSTFAGMGTMKYSAALNNAYPVGWATLYSVLLGNVTKVLSYKQFLDVAFIQITQEGESQGDFRVLIDHIMGKGKNGTYDPASNPDVQANSVAPAYDSILGAIDFSHGMFDPRVDSSVSFEILANALISGTAAFNTLNNGEAAEVASTINQTMSELKRLIGNIRDLCIELRDQQGCADSANNHMRQRAEEIFTGAPGSMQKKLVGAALAVVGGVGSLGLEKALSAYLLARATDVADEQADETLAELASKSLFREQCWLLSYLDLIGGYKKNHLDGGDLTKTQAKAEGTAYKRLPYISGRKLCYTASPADIKAGLQTEVRAIDKNATLLLDGDPYAFMNELTLNPKTELLFDLENHELSNLQPLITLSKVTYDRAGWDLDETLINFDSHVSSNSIDRMLKNKAIRGEGVGIKSFNFSYEGSNPFAVKKSIKANLKLFANNMYEIFRPRGGYRYSDLAMKTGTTDFIKMAKDACVDITKETIDRHALNFRLRAKVGLGAPFSTTGFMEDQAGTRRKKIQEALAESYVTLNLTPTVHNFEIDDQGRVIFNINYLAYIEEFFDQRAFNVFANAVFKKVAGVPVGGKVAAMAATAGELIAASRMKREFKLESLAKVCKPDQVNEEKEGFAAAIDLEMQHSIGFLVETLMLKDLIYYVDIPMAEIKTFNVSGPYNKKSFERWREKLQDPKKYILKSQSLSDHVASDVNAALGSFTAGAENDSETLGNITAALASEGVSSARLAFFYLSDLIDAVLENIETEFEALQKLLANWNSSYATLKLQGQHISKAQITERRHELAAWTASLWRLRILLGPAEFFTNEIGGNTQSVFLNLGDLPISVKYFAQFMTEKMLKKQEVFYPLTAFLNDILNNLVDTFLNNDSCFGFSIKQRTRVNQAAITSYSKGLKGSSKVDDLTYHIWRKGRGRCSYNKIANPLLSVSGPEGSARTSIPLQNEFNYFVYYAARTMPLELMVGNREQDKERGIFHYVLGRDKGLVKNIKLSKTQTKGLAEVRFEQDGYDGLQQLRVIYDVQIDSVMNVNTFPGTYIFVDPRGFAPQKPDFDSKMDLTDLGIGGYYMIVKSEHEFGEGYANTIIHAKWVNSIEADAHNKKCGKTEPMSGGNMGRVNKAKCPVGKRGAPGPSIGAATSGP